MVDRFTILLGRMPRMLHEILLHVLGERQDVELVETVGGANLAAAAERTAPSVIAVGRPDSDPISAGSILAASPSSRFVELSAEGRSAVLYAAGSAPRTLEGLAPSALFDLILSDTRREVRRKAVH